MPTESTKVRMTNRDVVGAHRALRTLVKDRGFPDHETAANVGRTIRNLRAAEEAVEEERNILIAAHAKLDEDGKPVEVGGAGVALKDPRAFIEELRKMERTVVEVEIWPVSLTALGGESRKCTKCKQMLGAPAPEDYATLLDVGILHAVGAT